MNRNQLCVLLLSFNITVFSQVNLPQVNAERIRITKNGMLVLGSWGAANLIVGAIGLSSSTGQAKYFHQMNFIWGSVNLAIAGSSLLAMKKRRTDISLSQSLKSQSAIEKTFLINGGLDLVYLTAGFYCMEKCKNQVNPDKYKGYGKSLFVQGGSLLLFDVIMYITNLNHGKQLYKVLDKVQFSGYSVGLVWKL
ncbi:MAG: hypothetical protein ABUT20_45745 [Bacteroidota bacterium]